MLSKGFRIIQYDTMSILKATSRYLTTSATGAILTGSESATIRYDIISIHKAMIFLNDI